MTAATTCPKLFEAEAMRDGRLGDAERASFRRHLTVCATCAREAQALEGLARDLRAGLPDDAHVDELHVLRERTRLLATFDRALVAPERRWSGLRWLPWPAALATVTALLVVAGGFVVLRGRPADRVVQASRTVIHADGMAVWSKRTEGNREGVSLERGTLWIHVDHTSPEEESRFVVRLPDGELEDQGTTFTVSVEDGHTRRVTVREGSVVLRIRGQAAVAIGPGGTWISDARPSSAASASASASALARPIAEPSLELEPPPRAQLALPARSPSRPRRPAPVAPASPDPFVEFRAAMAAFEAGDNLGAAAAFAGFVARHPGDPRAEDAAYLGVIALQRCGADREMKRAAREYQRRYPAGFRHAEVERLLQ